MYNEQFSHMRYFFFSQGSNGKGKDVFVFQYTCLQPHFSVKYKI